MSEPELVGIAQVIVLKAPQRICCMGLGSCIAIFIYDASTRTGGVAHVLLPKAPRASKTILKYADTAIQALLDELLAKGARRGQLRAKLVGGAQMFPNLNIKVTDIGRQNTEEAKRVLKKLGIRIMAEDTMGNRGRSAVFDLETGQVTITTAFSDSHVI